MSTSSKSSSLLENSQSHLAYAHTLHQNLMDLHQSLSQSYHMDQEDLIFRLSIERDEALVSWGKSILSLYAQGFTLTLSDPQGQTFPVMGPLDEEGLKESRSTLIHSNSTNEPIPSSTLQYQAVIVETPSSTPSSNTSAVPSSSSSRSSRHSSGSMSRSSSISSSSSLSTSISSSIDQEEEIEDETQGEADAMPISLTQFSLEDLKAQINQSKSWTHIPLDPHEPQDQEWKKLGQDMINRLGAPQIYSTHQVKEQLILLESEVECCQQWSVFDRDMQNAFLTLITSRLRKIQETLGENLFDQDRIAKMFRRLTRFSSDFRPGFIHGLSRDKVPEFDSWATDEKEAWKRLESALDFKKEVTALGAEAQKYLDEVKRVIRQGENYEQFSVELRRTVVDCLNFGIQPEHPHLIELILKYLGYLSGRRFKKLRQAALEYDK